MKLIGCMPVRNEDWILGLSARVALMWCDALVILDHASTDGSRRIMLDLDGEYPGRVILMTEAGEQWDEMQHRQAMLMRARAEGATHIAIIDADEVLSGNLLSGTGVTGEFISGVIQDHGIMQLPGYNLRGSIRRYHASGIWGQRWFSVVFADDPRLSWTGDRFHRREPTGLQLQSYRPIAQGQGGVMHLWGASERRLRAKHAWYKVTERLRWPNKSIAEIDATYSWAIDGRPQYGDGPKQWSWGLVPASWWKPYEALAAQYLDLHAEPWQEGAVRDAVALHGRAHFAGLDLFGVAA